MYISAQVIACMADGEAVAQEGDVITNDCNKCTCSKGKLLCTKFKCDKSD